MDEGERRTGPWVDLGPLGRLMDLGSEEELEEIERRFSVGAAPTLRTRNLGGRTEIQVGADGEIVVVARKRARAATAEKVRRLLASVVVRSEQTGDVVDVGPRSEERERGWPDLFRGGRVRVDLDITVPAATVVEAHTVSGPLLATGLRRRIEAHSVSGGIRVADACGHIALKAVSGDVLAVGCAGRIEANTVSGDIGLDGCRASRAELVTVSGDVDVVGRLDAGDDEHRIRSISGDVTLALAGLDYEIGLRTMSGELSLEAEGEVRVEGRRDRTVRLGAGERPVRVTVKTVSGDLTIRGGEVAVPTTPVAAETPEPPVAGDPAREILERVARGELDAAAAAAALDRLRS